MRDFMMREIEVVRAEIEDINADNTAPNIDDLGRCHAPFDNYMTIYKKGQFVPDLEAYLGYEIKPIDTKLLVSYNEALVIDIEVGNMYFSTSFGSKWNKDGIEVAYLYIRSNLYRTVFDKMIKKIKEINEAFTPKVAEFIKTNEGRQEIAAKLIANWIVPCRYNGAKALCKMELESGAVIVGNLPSFIEYDSIGEEYHFRATISLGEKGYWFARPSLIKKAA